MTSPPDDVVPWTPHQAHRQITMMRDHYQQHPDPDVTPAGVLNVVLTQLEYMVCPHADCPTKLLDHPPLKEEGDPA